MPFPHAKRAVAAASAGVALASAPAFAQSPVATRADALDPLVEMTQRAHAKAVRINVRVHGTNARLRGERPERGRSRDLRDWSLDHVRDDSRATRKRNRVLRRRAAERAERAGAPAGGGVATPAHLQAIAACESGDDPGAIGGGGQYRGKYQFDHGTWASVGGTGDPAAAPEAEQDRRAAILYARAGASPWPVCGG